MPFVEHDPFVNIMLDAGPIPPSGAYSYFNYWLTLLVFSPMFFLVVGTLISLFTWEWGDYTSARGEMRRQAWLTARGLMITSVPLAFMMRAILEQKVGSLRYDLDDAPWYYHLAMGLGFFLIHDFAFYCLHRLWHSPRLYALSHRLHHTCRPTTTYAASAADAAEIVITGYIPALAPAVLLPMSARLFLACDLFGHIWSIYLHNHDAHRWGFGLYDPHDHNIHHYYGQANYNFGLYFQLWDRILGTYRGAAPSKRLNGKNSRRSGGVAAAQTTPELLHEGVKEA